MIAKQKSNIAQLADSNRDLGYTLSLHRSNPRDVESKLFFRSEQAASQEAELVEQKYEYELTRGFDLQTKLKTISMQISEAKSKNNSSISTLTNPVAFSPSIPKLMSILERKLDKLVLQTNQIINNNSSIREKLELLRIEGKTVTQLENKLRLECQNLSRSIEQIIEETTSNYKAKDKASNEWDRLRSMADRERADFDKELAHINKLLQGDLKVHEYLNRKSFKRKSQSLVPPQTVSQPPSVVPAQTESSKENEYEEQFNQLKSALGYQSISELINRYISKEISNFSLFSRSRLLTHQMKDMDIAIEEADSLLKSIRSRFAYPEFHDGTIDLEVRKLKADSDIMEKRINRIEIGIDDICSILSISTNNSDEGMKLMKIDAKIDYFIEKKISKNAISNIFSHSSPIPPTSIAREIDDNYQPLTREDIAAQLAKETKKDTKKNRSISASTTRPPSTKKYYIFYLSSPLC